MTLVLDSKALATHVLLAIAAHRGTLLTVADVARIVGARRPDVRRVVSRLHEEGFVDALRMRLTLAGLTLASALRRCVLRDVRPTGPTIVAA
jgi:DNA-binding IclR family transcriptional regulator